MRMHSLNRHSLLYTLIVACIMASPILLAGLAQAYFYYVPSELHWISFSWRVRGWPVLLRFPFWEWVTCVVLSVYMMVPIVVTYAVYPTRKVSGRKKICLNHGICPARISRELRSAHAVMQKYLFAIRTKMENICEYAAAISPAIYRIRGCSCGNEIKQMVGMKRSKMNFDEHKRQMENQP